jgi:hypothetical protein
MDTRFNGLKNCLIESRLGRSAVFGKLALFFFFGLARLTMFLTGSPSKMNTCASASTMETIRRYVERQGTKELLRKSNATA